MYNNKIVCIICLVLVRVSFDNTIKLQIRLKWRWLSFVPHKLMKFKYVSDPYRTFEKLSMNVQTQYPLLQRIFWQVSLICIISCLFHQIGFDKHPLHILYCIFTFCFIVFNLITNEFLKIISMVMLFNEKAHFSHWRFAYIK